jgi:hypothetical protein
MSGTSPWPRAFGGAPLVGERVVRIVYMDESGTSAKEEIALFSAVMVDADKQWKAVEKYLTRLIHDGNNVASKAVQAQEFTARRRIVAAVLRL